MSDKATIIELAYAKMKTADEHQRWHAAQGYREESQYFKGWSYGLLDLIQTLEPRKKTGPKPKEAKP